jgi:hypothetical protein
MTLYHYTSGQGIFGIINSGELHCSNVNFLNDPSEQSYFQELLVLVFKKSKECEKIYSTLFNDSFQQAVVDPFERFVASFSKNADSLSMWNYYAKGNGYSVIEENEDANLSIQKIELIYNEVQQLEDTTKFILSHKDNCDKWEQLDEELKTIKEDIDFNLTLEQNYLMEDFNDGIHKLKIGFKHQAYEREHEIKVSTIPFRIV